MRQRSLRCQCQMWITVTSTLFFGVFSGEELGVLCLEGVFSLSGDDSTWERRVRRFILYNYVPPQFYNFGETTDFNSSIIVIASFTIRWTNTLHVGMSLINPIV
jgi:hypothetical protein